MERKSSAKGGRAVLSKTDGYRRIKGNFVPGRFTWTAGPDQSQGARLRCVAFREAGTKPKAEKTRPPGDSGRARRLLNTPTGETAACHTRH